ncbi:Protein rot1 [Leucoagaricus sp. SymC.cos]|nr:Protein rot1 [Leucoagaricus sp. SymC.cos]
MATAKNTLIGTWSSGSKNVLTGQNFANPVNMSFNYPKTTGISYSFTDTYYEISRYRFNSNGSEPTCITGVIGWSHGKYQLNPNGSMTMFPFSDGFQQVQDPCAAVSENFIETYMIKEELYQQWLIFVDPTQGPKLHMYQFDNSPLAPMFKVSDTPIMLPTQLLRNVTDPGSPVDPNANPNQDPNSASTPQRRSVANGAGNRWSNSATMTGVSGVLVAAFASLVL